MSVYKRYGKAKQVKYQQSYSLVTSIHFVRRDVIVPTETVICFIGTSFLSQIHCYLKTHQLNTTQQHIPFQK